MLRVSIEISILSPYLAEHSSSGTRGRSPTDFGLFPIEVFRNFFERRILPRSDKFPQYCVSTSPTYLCLDPKEIHDSKYDAKEDIVEL
jgi:hypothetical protein